MTSTVLVLNAGSSSVKYQLVTMPDELRFDSGLVEKIGEPGGRFASHDEALEEIVSAVAGRGLSIDIVGHRVVHGGVALTQPTLITPDVVTTIETLIPLAPLHNPANLEGIRAAQKALPDADHVAVFDTGFFADLPPESATYALPKELRTKWGVRKFGFHGTSHDYVSAELRRREPTARKVITAHLGNGSSLAAIVDGNPVDTTLGFTPLPGLVMGTRSGDVDPAIIFYLQRMGMTPDEVERALTREGGMLGLTGLSDMRDIIQRADAGDADCELALRIWAGRMRHYVGAYWATMGGLDALVFTAGIGENSSVLRARVCSLLEPLGVVIDSEKNASSNRAARTVSADESRVAVWVIPTDEEIQIARSSHHLVRGHR